MIDTWAVDGSSRWLVVTTHGEYVLLLYETEEEYYCCNYWKLAGTTRAGLERKLLYSTRLGMRNMRLRSQAADLGLSVAGMRWPPLSGKVRIRRDEDAAGEEHDNEQAGRQKRQELEGFQQKWG